MERNCYDDYGFSDQLYTDSENITLGSEDSRDAHDINWDFMDSDLSFIDNDMPGTVAWFNKDGTIMDKSPNRNEDGSINRYFRQSPFIPNSFRVSTSRYLHALVSNHFFRE